MTTTKKKLKDIKAADYNPRVTLTPADPEWRDIEASIRDFGQVVNLVVNRRNNTLVSGHQRLAVMRHMGLKEATVVEVDVDDATERRMNLALNKVGGKWDVRRLEVLMSEMSAAGTSLDSLGWAPADIRKILNATRPPPKNDPDAEAPAPSTVPIAKEGDVYDLWIEGSDTAHRIVCGDSSDAAATDALMQGDLARMIFTDPPYGVSYGADDTARDGEQAYDGPIANDDLRGDALKRFLERAFVNLTRHTIDRAALYCFYASCNHIQFEHAINAAGWRVKQQIIWVKQMVLSRSDYHWSHEPMLYCVRQGHNCDWLGDRAERTTWGEHFDPDKLTKEDAVNLLKSILDHSSVWQEKRDAAQSYIHPTQKATALARRAIRNSSLPGEIVLEPFCGSGSTLIAAELEGRQCRAIELSPAYVDAEVARYLATFHNARAMQNQKPYET